MPTKDSQTGSSQTAMNGRSEPANRPLDNLTIVGIAAAAGGLVPLRTFLAALPPGTGMTFVVVAHLAPNETSALPDELRSAVALPVTQVRTRVALLTVGEQEERRRISALLHDDLQQRLFSLNIQLSIVRQLQEEGALDEANQVIEETSTALQEAVQVTRSLSVSLSPPVLHDDGLPEAIHWLAALMQQQHGLAVTVQAAPELPPLDDDVLVLLFELVLELLFNVVKHAGVDAATVDLAATAGALQIQVSDHDKGFDPAAQAGGGSSQRFKRAEQRLQLIGGEVQVKSQAGAGTRIIIYAPLHNGAVGAGSAQPMNG